MMKTISNTEVTTKNTCTKMHEYMYNDELEPRQYSMAIRRGNAGHKVFEDYYSARKDGWNHLAAADHAMNTIYGIVGQSDPDDIEHTQMLSHLIKILKRYFDYYKDDNHKIIAVESLFTAPITDDTLFGVYLDVLWEITSGPYRGSLEIVDHKFVNNFKSPAELRIDSQQPKYLKVAQLNNLPIRGAIFNQIRYRSMKDPTDEQLFRRSPLTMSQVGVDTVWEETRKAIEEKRGVVRALTYSACKHCFVQDLCMTELAGEPTDLMRKIQYQQRKRPLKDWMLSNA